MSFVVQTLIAFLNIYFVLLIVRILLSWFQTAEWAYQIMAFLSPVTDPYLNIFRSFIPPIGGIDISAILAIFALQIVQGALATIPTVAMGF
ncbi:MAG: YggT family protein [Xenococcaceae cyanobacterium MO_188.B29]|nr:YggT family protein [Xenococcaceae cyanobacterium MO_188.B29]